MGAGTYGRVYVCSTDDNTKYAVKRNIVEKTTHGIASGKELDVLGKMGCHPYIVKIGHVSFGSPFGDGNMSPVGDLKRDDGIHFIMEKASSDASSLIRNPAFPLIHRKYSMCQVALAMEYLHCKGIMHLDLKPDNLLYFNRGDGKQCLKICDFGISMPWTYQGEFSTRVVTACYRPPEIVMGHRRYDFKADVWSLGCVFFEMISGKQLYPLRADNNQTLLKDIFTKHPTPITRISVERMSRESGYDYQIPQVKKKRPSFIDLLALSDDTVADFQEHGTLDEFVELLSGMLAFDPKDRWSMTQVIKSKFFQCWANEINAIRRDYPPTQPPVPIVHVENVPERTIVSSIICDLFKNRRKHEWYDHRILFQTISFYDRWLKYKYAGFQDSSQSGILNPTAQVEVRNSLTRNQEREAQLQFLACLYLAIKYFSPLVRIISFNDLVHRDFATSENLEKARKFEERLIRDVMKMDIYHGTLYEAADYYNDRLTDDQVCQLLKVYCNSAVMSRYNGRNVANHQIYQECRRSMNDRFE